jgi:hypothetical protein
MVAVETRKPTRPDVRSDIRIDCGGCHHKKKGGGRVYVVRPRPTIKQDVPPLPPHPSIHPCAPTQARPVPCPALPFNVGLR